MLLNAPTFVLPISYTRCVYLVILTLCSTSEEIVGAPCSGYGRRRDGPSPCCGLRTWQSVWPCSSLQSEVSRAAINERRRK